MRQLAQQSGYSQATLRRLIGYWLSRPPRLSLDLSLFHHLVIDGTYVEGQKQGVVAIADPTRNRIVTGWYGVTEGGAVMKRFCEELTRHGLSPRSVTIDGARRVHKLVGSLWPQALIQRCLVHVQRQGLSWCRRKPRRTDAKHLRSLFLQVCDIHSIAERDAFLAAWQGWEKRFGSAIADRPDTGWVFSDLRRARSMLQKALPFMFAYLDHPAIPSSTNWLESYFSRLKARYRQHRGLARNRRASYFTWYFHLCRT